MVATITGSNPLVATIVVMVLGSPSKATSGNDGQLNGKIEGEKKQGKALYLMKSNHQQLKLDRPMVVLGLKKKRRKRVRI